MEYNRFSDTPFCCSRFSRLSLVMKEKEDFISWLGSVQGANLPGCSWICEWTANSMLMSTRSLPWYVQSKIPTNRISFCPLFEPMRRILETGSRLVATHPGFFGCSEPKLRRVWVTPDYLITNTKLLEPNQHTTTTPHVKSQPETPVAMVQNYHPVKWMVWY